LSDFACRSVRLVGRITLRGPVDEVFQLFSPLGEKLWVPDWNPVLLHPSGLSWEEGLIFRTREEMGDAIWVVTRLNRAAHEVEYFRIEPARYVARIAVRCASVADQVTEASTVYKFVGLSEAGNGEIALTTQASYT
jgi:hypothetical protein